MKPTPTQEQKELCLKYFEKYGIYAYDDGFNGIVIVATNEEGLEFHLVITDNEVIERAALYQENKAEDEADLRYSDLLKFGEEKMLDCDELPLFPFVIDSFTPVITNSNEENFYVDFGDNEVSDQNFERICELAKDFKVDGRSFEVKRSSVDSALFFCWN